VGPLTATVDELDEWHYELPQHPEARATEISHVRQWLRWLADTRRRGDNPAVTLTRPKLSRRMDDDLHLAIATAPVEVATWLTMAGYAGLRCMEIAHLRCDDRRGRSVFVCGKDAPRSRHLRIHRCPRPPTPAGHQRLGSGPASCSAHGRRERADGGDAVKGAGLVGDRPLALGSG